MTRILIVEDEESLGGTLRELLVAEGYEVDLATNGVDALEACATKTPDVILLDMMLPILDGVGFLKRMHVESNGRRPTVIAMSSASASAFENAGFDHFLAKPFRFDALLALLARGGSS